MGRLLVGVISQPVTVGGRGESYTSSARKEWSSVGQIRAPMGFMAVINPPVGQRSDFPSFICG